MKVTVIVKTIAYESSDVVDVTDSEDKELIDSTCRFLILEAMTPFGDRYSQNEINEAIKTLKFKDMTIELLEF